jgi:hypothetical protein
MSLSDSTINNLAIALTPEVIDSILQDESWAEYLTEIIPEIVSKKLGSQDIDLVTEITVYIMDNINMKPYQTV